MEIEEDKTQTEQNKLNPENDHPDLQSAANNNNNDSKVQTFESINPLSNWVNEEGLDADTFAHSALSILIGGSDVDSISDFFKQKLSQIQDWQNNPNDMTQLQKQELLHVQYWSINRIANQTYVLFCLSCD